MESVGSPFVSFLVVLPLRREEREGGREGGREAIWNSISRNNAATMRAVCLALFKYKEYSAGGSFC